MKITRCASDKPHGPTTLVNSQSEVVQVGSGLELRVYNVPDRYNDATHNVHHDYTVKLSRKDLLRILDELLLEPLFDGE